jgi:hypothetical protein
VWHRDGRYPLKNETYGLSSWLATIGKNDDHLAQSWHLEVKNRGNTGLPRTRADLAFFWASNWDKQLLAVMVYAISMYSGLSHKPVSKQPVACEQSITVIKWMLQTADWS